MKVLFISHNGRRNGGAQNVLFNLMRALPRDQFDLHCLFPEGGSLYAAVEALGVTCHRVRFKWWAGFELDTLYKITQFCLGIKESSEEVARIIKDNQIDLVVSNTITMAEGAFAAQLAGVPHIWYVHEILSRDPKLKHFMKLEFLYPLMVQLSKLVIVVSKTARYEFEYYIAKAERERYFIDMKADNNLFDLNKIRVLYNGVDMPPDDFSRQENNRILSVGGICRRKGQLDLLEAAVQVIDRFPDAEFHLAGSFWERQYRHELLQRRLELGLERKFSFYKWVEDMPTFYKSGCMLVSPSHCESFGLSLLEGMTYKLPVVTTDSGGPSEIVTGETGFICPVGDVDGLAKGMISILTDPKTATLMGVAGRKRVEEFFKHEDSVKRFTNLLVEGGKNET